MRRLRAPAVSSAEAQRHATSERHPLLRRDDAQAVLVAALVEAARSLVGLEAKPVEGRVERHIVQPDTSTAEQRRARQAALARHRLARAETPVALRVALFDLGRTGSPDDAALVLPWLDAENVEVRAAALDALAALCAPGSADAVRRRMQPDPSVLHAEHQRALRRLEACASLPVDR
jgi:hypothetical protein